MKCKYLVLKIIFLYIFLNSNGQERMLTDFTKMDSLQQLIDSHSKNDREKVILLNEYARQCFAEKEFLKGLTVNEKAKNNIDDYKPEVIVKTSLIPPSGGGGALISVIDNGPGIPSEIKDKIFQPFFTTKPTGQGTGLGLSLSYDIVKSHGGELKVETKEGEGTVFMIILPV
jgi:signal transduction histidine kinase